jgi:hypothetical protein
MTAATPAEAALLIPCNLQDILGQIIHLFSYSYRILLTSNL